LTTYREPDRGGPTSTTPYNTLGRPQGSQGYDDSTLSAGRMPAYKSHNMNGRMDGTMVHGHSNPAMNMEPGKVMFMYRLMVFYEYIYTVKPVLN